jgi:acyl carrier protein
MDELTQDSSPEKIESWDSLNHLNLVLALEQEFSVKFTPDEIERIDCVGAVTELLDQKTRT